MEYKQDGKLDGYDQTLQNKNLQKSLNLEFYALVVYLRSSPSIERVVPCRLDYST